MCHCTMSGLLFAFLNLFHLNQIFFQLQHICNHILSQKAKICWRLQTWSISNKKYIASKYIFCAILSLVILFFIFISTPSCAGTDISLIHNLDSRVYQISICFIHGLHCSESYQMMTIESTPIKNRCCAVLCCSAY